MYQQNFRTVSPRTGGIKYVNTHTCMHTHIHAHTHTYTLNALPMCVQLCAIGFVFVGCDDRYVE